VVKIFTYVFLLAVYSVRPQWFAGGGGAPPPPAPPPRAPGGGGEGVGGGGGGVGWGVFFVGGV